MSPRFGSLIGISTLPLHSDAVNKLAHQNVVANLKRFQHGARGNLEGLDNKGADEKSKQPRDNKRLYIFAGN
jgi:hypothetical protein